MERAPFNYEEIISDFQAACVEMIDNPADNDDPHLKMIPQALLELTEEYDGIREEIVEIATSPKRSRDESQYLINLIIRAANTEQLTEDRNGDVHLVNPDYPDNYKNVDDWKEYLYWLFDLNNSDFFYNITQRDIQSNIYQRYLNLKLLPHIFPGELPEAFSILDFGASLNRGLNGLARNQEFPFEYVIVRDANYDETPPEYIPHDVEAAISLNDALQSPFSLGPSMGVEFWPMRDPKPKLWAAGCLYPGEFRNKKRLRILNELIKPAQGVNFRTNVDCANPEKLAERIGDKKFDVVSIFLMLHQNTEEERSKILENARHYAKRYVAIFDVASYDPFAPNKLYFEDVLYKKPYGFKSLVDDRQEKSDDFQEFMRYADGRCRDVILNMGHAAVRDAFS